MDKILILLIIICIGLILYGIINRRYDLILNFGLRILVGFICIFLFNRFFDLIKLNVEVGTNSFNALAIGLLGLPGFILLYGIALYFHLF